MTKERPILFSAPMIRAILEGRKTQTRRVVKVPDGHKLTGGLIGSGGQFGAKLLRANGADHLEFVKCPYGDLGDELWVRESFRFFDAADECGCSEAPCPCPRNGTPLYRATHEDGESKWKPSIHMPRAASRIQLRVTNVRVRRLHGISNEDARAEGVTEKPCDASAKDAFAKLWRTIHPSTIRKNGTYIDNPAKWNANPWVWVVDFERLKP